MKKSSKNNTWGKIEVEYYSVTKSLEKIDSGEVFVTC